MKFLSYHLGLGDALICAGLVKKISEKEKIIIPCYRHNLSSVSSIHINNTNVEIVAVDNANDIKYLEDKYESIILHGFGFPKGFYHQAEVDWKERWDSCPVFEQSMEIHFKFSSTDDIFVHDDSERGFNINIHEGTRVFNIGHSILEYIDFIRGCKEIHCIDSSFLHLVECIPAKKFTNNPKFFYHKSARPHSVDYTGCLLHDWKVV